MKPLLIALLMGICTPIFAQEIDLRAIAKIESAGCKAPCIGDNGKAIGIYQIHKGVVADFNRIGPRRSLQPLSHLDMKSDKEAGIVADWYLNVEIPRLLKHYGLPDSLDNRLTAYNMGIGRVKEGKRASKYIAKYNTFIKYLSLGA